MDAFTLSEAPSRADDEAPRALPPYSVATTKADWDRRRSNPAVGFSHVAFLSRDIERTRHFYEDIVGMPLVDAVKVKGAVEATLDGPTDLIHFFFEMADGGALGFFGLEPGKHIPVSFPHDEMQLHFAVQMEKMEDIKAIGERATAAGYKCTERDMGPFCYSLYIDDPDGISFELCLHRDRWFSAIDTGAARAAVDEWVANGEKWT